VSDQILTCHTLMIALLVRWRRLFTTMMDCVDINASNIGINFPSSSPLGTLIASRDPKIPPSLRIDQNSTSSTFFPNEQLVLDSKSLSIGFLLTSTHLGSGQSPKIDLDQEWDHLSSLLRQNEIDTENGYMSGPGLFNLGIISLITAIPSSEVIAGITTGSASLGIRCECPQDANVVFLTTDPRDNQSPLQVSFTRVRRSYSHPTSVTFFQPSLLNVSNPSTHFHQCQRCLEIPEILFTFLLIIKHTYDTQLVELVCFVVGLCLAR
jgi:hypothetical protein